MARKVSQKVPQNDENWISYHYKILIAICLLLVVILGGLLYFAYQPNSIFFGRVIWHQVTDQKIVALTFDDGPNGQATLQTLDILKKENIPATFFLVGANVVQYPDIAKQIVFNGNEVGNHSYYHNRILPFTDEKVVEAELLKANQVINKATGQTPIYFRPPHGFRTPWAIRAAHKAGFIIVTWNDSTHDYMHLNAATIEKNIIVQLRPGGIIDLHDGFGTVHGANRDEMLKALPVIIETAKAQGYSFVTVSQLLAIGQKVPVPANKIFTPLPASILK